MNHHICTIGFWALFAGCLLATERSPAGEEPADPGGGCPLNGGELDFVRDVEPVLAKRCYACHGPDQQEGRLRLDARAAVFAGGVGGPAIIPGNVDESPIVRRIAGLDGLDRMPLDLEPLSEQETATLRKWIEQGAQWPDGVGADVKVKRHWAYVKPVRPAVPAVSNAEWARNAIDVFILSRMEREGLRPSGEAAKEQLLRRVTLDLVGVPPTLDEIDAFVADDTPSAYEHAVERLLASPRYGERWAVPWLDAARYADSNGYQRDGRREAWAYRDWVISSLNEDLPFDRFTIEQIAGDLLPNATLAQRVATGFHRGTMANVEAGTDPEEVHVLAVIDRVNTTGTVWLGTTIECAQCHNHKYDPFTQREYYRLYAFFNNTEKEIEAFPDESRREFTGPTMALPVSPEQAQRHAAAAAQLTRLRGDLTAATSRFKEDQADWERATLESAGSDDSQVPERVRRILRVDANSRSEEQQQALDDFRIGRSEELKKLKKRFDQMQSEADATAAPTTLVMQELPEPRKTRIFQRGNFLNPGEAVKAGTPAALHPLAESKSLNRLALARWLVDADNPLVARVTVNRHWQEFFGQGLVATAEDFGTRAEAPTNPELLDWLATEFVRCGWSVKDLHRLIVTSATYRQASQVTEVLLEKDPHNRLYARGPRFRMKAEFIRDNALAVSGLLSDTMYGPPVFPYQPLGVWNHTGRASNVWPTSPGEDRYRRGLYVYWRRTVPYPSFVNFDAPSREACSVTRSRSNTPLQALTLLNDPAYLEAAAALAKRIATEPAMDAAVEQRIEFGFRLATSRKPSTRETAILTDRFRAEFTRYQSQPRAAAELLAEHRPPKGVEPAAFAAWIHVANVVLNLDEAITKN